MKSLRPADLHAASVGPLTLAARGFFWCGGERLELRSGAVLRGQMYVEYWIPQDLRQPWPIVMVHGGGGQGLDFLGTADGREGWVHWFVRKGHAVYVVDRPGLGRAPFHPAILGDMAPPPTAAYLEEKFTRPEAFPESYPQARLHHQWPGPGTLGDANFDQFFCGAGPSQADLAGAHRDTQRAAAALLDAIGPSILLTHSAGAPTGWLAADVRPHLVKAIIAVEPLGPPFSTSATGRLSWGLTAAPLAYQPPARGPEDLELELRSPRRAGAAACWMQKEPARQLSNLQGFPIAIVTSEASWKTLEDHGTVDYLSQAGTAVEHLRLEEHGIHGNGHAMMLELNSDAVAALLEQWIRTKG
ncbi:MAG TPA: alpha/beta hydrolase, partial [Steroidobacteraceae bacterium]|nr:alpha/beta hydrolase [Steroidobacteraceae bacterium]